MPSHRPIVRRTTARPQAFSALLRHPYHPYAQASNTIRFTRHIAVWRTLPSAPHRGGKFLTCPYPGIDSTR